MSRYSIDDSPYYTGILLQEGAAGKTDVAAMVLFDGVENAMVCGGDNRNGSNLFTSLSYTNIHFLFLFFLKYISGVQR